MQIPLDYPETFSGTVGKLGIFKGICGRWCFGVLFNFVLTDFLFSGDGT